MIENLLIGYLLVSLLKELKHETPQNVTVRIESPIQQNGFSYPQEKHCGEPDARRYSAVNDAMPSAYICTQKGLR